MSSTTHEQLLRFFAEAAGTASGSPGPAGATANDQSYAATPVGTSSEGGAESGASGSGGTGSTIESALTTFLEGGLGVVPLVTGLMGLFDGGSAAPPQLEKYEKPSAIDFVSAETQGGLVGADYDQLGMPRMADTVLAAPAVGSSSGGGNSPAPESGGRGQNGTLTPQVTVSVQAIDAQSILDRSSDIAQAVRSAMLNMSSINDVISDL